jgi:methionine--tRNA ligase beta chain
MKPTTHWYLPMERSQQWVEQWINTGMLDGEATPRPSEWKPQVLGQCNSWLKDGLRPRAMTRDLDWGVPVPLPGADGKVLYVWLDAPIGYISATKQWAALRQAQEPTDWEKWWKADDTRLVQFIGKDNIVFHCIIFPILLKLHGGYVLPQNVPANEFLNLEGRKISTSRNWAVWLHEYIERWPGRQDELRYALASIIPEFRDSEFTWKDFQDKNNNELVAILGNFVQRVFVLTEAILAACARLVGLLSVALDPFLPYTARKLREGLQIPLTEWDEAPTALLPATGHGIGQLPILFSKITDEEVSAQIEKLHASRQEQQAPANPIRESVDFELFQKMDLRIVTILTAEKVAKTKKLLKLTVDTGVGERTVVSGIAEHYTPEELIGKSALYLANLAPRDIKGITSHGMILMGEDASGMLSLMSPEKALRPGNEVR